MHKELFWSRIGIIFSLVFIFCVGVFFTSRIDPILRKTTFTTSLVEVRDSLFLSSYHEIVLTESGFKPETITIKRGDTIIFKTSLNKPFWPASNIHPAHTLYPAFDPKKPIAASDTWEFTFPDAGHFTFHDHLSANNTGLIIVTSDGIDTQATTTLNDLENINFCATKTTVGDKQQCWDEQLSFVLKQHGLETAFDYFLKLYETEPEVPKECHGWGHTLGKAAYALYKNGHKLVLRPEAEYCGYGYFHGFIGELIRDTGDLTQTKTFCEYVVSNLGNELKAIKQNCVHGVGHGISSMLSEDPAYWGDISKVVTRGTALCESIYTDPTDLENCYDGVFNEATLNLFENQYALNYDAYITETNGDVFLFCQSQKEQYRRSCYFEISGFFWKVFNNDVVASTKYALTHIDDLQRNGVKVIEKIAADRIQESIVATSHDDSITACRIVPDFLQKACFDGILNGFIQHGKPGDVHEKGFAYCAEKFLTEQERDSCYTDFTGQLEWYYTKEQLVRACEYLAPTRTTAVCSRALETQTSL